MSRLDAPTARVIGRSRCKEAAELRARNRDQRTRELTEGVHRMNNRGNAYSGRVANGLLLALFAALLLASAHLAPYIGAFQ